MWNDFSGITAFYALLKRRFLALAFSTTRALHLAFALARGAVPWHVLAPTNTCYWVFLSVGQPTVQIEGWYYQSVYLLFASGWQMPAVWICKWRNISSLSQKTTGAHEASDNFVMRMTGWNQIFLISGCCFDCYR